MKNLVFLITIFTASFTSIINCYAARADRRTHHQGTRIRQGARSGELTKGERTDLRKEQHNIKKEKHDMRADDGHLDRQERRELRADQNEASKNIYEEKHDSEKQE